MLELLSAQAGDPALMKLPHPVRVPLAMPHIEAMLREAFSAEWPRLEAYLRDTRLILPEACRQLALRSDMPRFQAVVQGSPSLPGSTEQGNLFGMMTWLRNRLVPVTHFLLDDALCELLEHTDIAEDIPLAYLTPPYPRLFLEFGKARNLTTTVPNLLSGDHVLEGAYVEQGLGEDQVPALYVTLIGSPLGKENAADDATLSVLLPLDCPEQGLSDAIRASFARANAQAHQAHIRPSPDHYVGASEQALRLVAKALLYIGLPDTRKALHPEATETAQQLAQLKSSAKRAKAQRQLARRYDYILVKADTSVPGIGRPHEPGRSVRAHWRRGHYRLQAHGPKLSARKVVFIRPTLVGEGPVEAPRAYKVV